MGEYVSLADIAKSVQENAALFSAPRNSVAVVGDFTRASLVSNVVMLEGTTGYKKCADLVASREDFYAVGHLLMYRTFLGQAEGNIVLRYDEKDRDRKVYDLLIPTILENDRITSINNIPKSRAQEIYVRDGNLGSIVGYRSVKEEVTKNLSLADRRSKDYPLSNSEAVIMAINLVGKEPLERGFKNYKRGAEKLMWAKLREEQQARSERGRGLRNLAYFYSNYSARRLIRNEQVEAQKLIKEAEKGYDKVVSELQSSHGLRRIKLAAIDILEGRRRDSKGVEADLSLKAIKTEVQRVVRSEQRFAEQGLGGGRKMNRGIG